jgi:Flp pilus assembly pilin Flp
MKQTLWQLVCRLCRDDAGMVQASSYILIVVLVGIGMVAGLTTFRDQVVQEFGDIADSIESLDQSFSFTIVDPNNVVIKTVVFDENNPPAPVPGPAFPAATSESGAAGSGSPPAGLAFVAATNEN